MSDYERAPVFYRFKSQLHCCTDFPKIDGLFTSFPRSGSEVASHVLAGSVVFTNILRYLKLRF